MSFCFPAEREEKPEDRDLLSDLQDVSDSERKTSTAESSSGMPRPPVPDPRVAQ